MRVKRTLGGFFEKLMGAYKETEESVPMTPIQKDIDQKIYIGDPDASGWCRWASIEQPDNRDFENLLNELEIENVHEDVIEYFTSYYFFGVDAKFQSYGIALTSIAPGDNFKRLRMMLDDPNPEYIPIGVEYSQNYRVSIEIKTGIVTFEDDETGKRRKITSSIEEFINGLEPPIQ